ncbi:MAG: hypothetical protein AAGE52_17955 [Myxococcota bacterium]
MNPELPLDDEAGPAKSLSAEASEALALSIVDRWAEERAPAQTSSGRAGWSAAAGLVVGFLLAGSMAAALYAVMRPDPAPVPAPARSTPAPVVVEDEPDEAEATPDEAPAEETRPVERAPRTADLLARANAARREGEYRRAAGIYARVARGRGTEAYTAAVAAGALELEHLGRPRQAARHFRRAARLRPRGPLDLSVREGLSTAERRLGRVAAERAALEELIERHPDSNAAARARRRLSEVGD